MTFAIFTLLALTYLMGYLSSRATYADPMAEKINLILWALLIIIIAAFVVGDSTVLKKDCQPLPQQCLQYEATSTGWECSKTGVLP